MGDALADANKEDLDCVGCGKQFKVGLDNNSESVYITISFQCHLELSKQHSVIDLLSKVRD